MKHNRVTAPANDHRRRQAERSKLLGELGEYLTGLRSNPNVQARLQRELELCLESEANGVELPVEPLAA